MNNIKTTIKRLKQDLNNAHNLKECEKSRSWVKREGILISVEEAEEIVEYFELKTVSSIDLDLLQSRLNEHFKDWK